MPNPDMIIFVLVVLASIATVFSRRQERERMRQIAEEGIEPAFSEEIRFPDVDWSQAQRLAPLVQRVVVMRNMGGVAGGEAGEDFRVTYTAFVVDTNSATHDLKTSPDWAAVQRPAERLAEVMGVEFVDTSYGTF